MLSNNTSYSPAAIRRLLLRLGATPRYIGFNYAIHAITLSLENSHYLLSVTKELYPNVARKHHTTIYSVERDIRTVITIIWKRNSSLLNQIAGYPLVSKPSVGEFIAIMREYFLCHSELAATDGTPHSVVLHEPNESTNGQFLSFTKM